MVEAGRVNSAPTTSCGSVPAVGEGYNGRERAWPKPCAYIWEGSELLQFFEAAEFWFDAEEVDGEDLDEEEGDHEGDNAGDAVGAEEEDDEEWGEDGGGTAEGVAEAEGAHANVGGEEFGDVDGEEQGDEDVDADDEEETGEGKQAGIADERIDAAEKDR